MTFTKTQLEEARAIIDAIDVAPIELMVSILVRVRDAGGRLFFLGVGGSAGNCGHAVNDFRKIVGIEAYTPTDNVSELIARTNYEGWETVFVEWLKTSRLKATDAVFVFSVGGGDLEKNVSPNLVRVLQYAKEIRAKILGVVGRDGGYTAKVGDAVCIVPTVNPNAVTPHSEAFQAIIWHLLVAHPLLKGTANEVGRDTLTVRSAQPAIFLDRDGVLNEVIIRNGKPDSPRGPNELIIAKGTRAALEELKREGFLLIVVTNQPNVMRGKTTRADVDQINVRLAAALPLDAIEVCEHDDQDQCECRKPKTGMILRARERFGVNLARSFMVGDRWRDIEAGRRAGCRTVLIGEGYGEIFPSAPTIKLASLPSAASWINQQSRIERGIA
jgi:D-sedoheptulose 7-phosphate isomerase